MFLVMEAAGLGGETALHDCRFNRPPQSSRGPRSQSRREDHRMAEQTGPDHPAPATAAPATVEATALTDSCAKWCNYR